MKQSFHGRLLLPLAAAVVLAACGNNDEFDQPSSGAPRADVTTGTIRGFVRLQGSPPAAATDPITQDQATCGNSVSLPRIALGKDSGVGGVFVYLDEVPNEPSVAPNPNAAAILVDQKDCQYVPHTLIVSRGSTVEIVNSDPILHNVHGNQKGDDGMQTVFNIAQPVAGTRSSVDFTMTKPGIVVLSCDAGHPWMSAFIFVRTHPFVALTDKDGQFVIPNVRPGTYKIKMWHEGVTLKQFHRKLQTYEYEEPYEMTQEVVVAANQETGLNFDLTLRK